MRVGFKRNKQKCNFQYAAMSMLWWRHKTWNMGISQKQKSRYIENQTLFFLQIRKLINNTSRAHHSLTLKNFWLSHMELSYKVSYSVILCYYYFKTKTTLRVPCEKSKMVSFDFSKMKNFFLNGIHSMQGWTATTRHGVTRKETRKRLQDRDNLFRKNLQLKDVC